MSRTVRASRFSNGTHRCGKTSYLQGFLSFRLNNRTSDYLTARFVMQLISSRTYPFLDGQTLGERQARDTLLRIGENEFLLHMMSEDGVGEERLVWLDCRSALLWISQEAEEYGIDWE
jgi:hypothetical protein